MATVFQCGFTGGIIKDALFQYKGGAASDGPWKIKKLYNELLIDGFMLEDYEFQCWSTKLAGQIIKWKSPSKVVYFKILNLQK